MSPRVLIHFLRQTMMRFTELPRNDFKIHAFLKCQSSSRFPYTDCFSYKDIIDGKFNNPDFFTVIETIKGPWNTSYFFWKSRISEHFCKFCVEFQPHYGGIWVSWGAFYHPLLYGPPVASHPVYLNSFIFVLRIIIDNSRKLFALIKLIQNNLFRKLKKKKYFPVILFWHCKSSIWQLLWSKISVNMCSYFGLFANKILYKSNFLNPQFKRCFFLNNLLKPTVRFIWNTPEEL